MIYINQLIKTSIIFILDIQVSTSISLCFLRQFLLFNQSLQADLVDYFRLSRLKDFGFYMKCIHFLAHNMVSQISKFSKFWRIIIFVLVKLQPNTKDWVDLILPLYPKTIDNFHQKIWFVSRLPLMIDNNWFYTYTYVF